MVNERATDHAALAAFIRSVIAEFGGLDNFTRVWMAALSGAMEKGRHATVLKSMQAIANLIAAHSRVDLSPVEQMTDQELKAEVLECLSHLTPDELAELGSG